MTKLEKRVLRLVMADYNRLRKLGWNRSYYGGLPKRLWDACAALKKGSKR